MWNDFVPGLSVLNIFSFVSRATSPMPPRLMMWAWYVWQQGWKPRNLSVKTRWEGETKCQQAQGEEGFNTVTTVLKYFQQKPNASHLSVWNVHFGLFSKVFFRAELGEKGLKMEVIEIGNRLESRLVRKVGRLWKAHFFADVAWCSGDVSLIGSFRFILHAAPPAPLKTSCPSSQTRSAATDIWRWSFLWKERLSSLLNGLEGRLKTTFICHPPYSNSMYFYFSIKKRGDSQHGSAALWRRD